MDDKTIELVDFANRIMMDSLDSLFKDISLREDYIQTDEITLKEKLNDLDEMTKFAESLELYEYCVMLKEMKNSILSN